MYQRVPVYAEASLSRIHDAAMDLLQNTGLVFNDDEAIVIFKKAGFKVEGKIVYFNEKGVLKALESAPSQFVLKARAPQKNVAVGGDALALAPGYGAPFVTGADGQQRLARMEDYANFCKLVQTSDVINVNGYLMVMPSDIPAHTAHLDMLLANIRLCDKPFIGSSASRDAAHDCIHISAMVFGGMEKLQAAPASISLITPLSPLQYTAGMAGAMIELARHSQACVIGTLLMAGATGPVSLAGVMALQTAEQLAGATLIQLVMPGAPVVIGGSSSITDMQTGELAMGAPEALRISNATVQMAHFYNLPARAGFTTSDAHLPDAQAGFEAALGLNTAICSGANFALQAAGILSAYNAMSYEKFIIDEDICRLVLEAVKPIEINDESIDLELIKEVGIGGNYLSHEKTYLQCRDAFFISDLIGRRGYAAWQEKGGLPLDHKAGKVFENRMRAYVKPDMDPVLEKDLIAYVEKRKNES